MRRDISNRIQNVTNRILQDYQNGRDIDNMNVFNQPDRTAVRDITYKLLSILFPGYYRPKFRSYNYDGRIAVVVEDVIYNLQKQISIALRLKEEYAAETDYELKMSAEELAIDFLDRPPKIRALVNTDMQASQERRSCSLQYRRRSSSVIRDSSRARSTVWPTSFSCSAFR